MPLTHWNCGDYVRTRTCWSQSTLNLVCLSIHYFALFVIIFSSNVEGKVGKLLRWNKNAPLLSQNLLLVQVGSLIYNQSYFFHIYYEDDLKKIGQGLFYFILFKWEIRSLNF